MTTPFKGVSRCPARRMNRGCVRVYAATVEIPEGFNKASELLLSAAVSPCLAQGPEPLPKESLVTASINTWIFQVHPRGDRVLVKVAEEETKTRGGILLPTTAVKKPTSGRIYLGVGANVEPK